LFKSGLASEHTRVLEVGSNNGEFLNWFVDKTRNVLGVDPAKDAALIANTRGVPTLVDFFDFELAEKILETTGTFDFVAARHMLAHNSDPHEIIRAVDKVLHEDGILYIENAYALDTIKKGEFDQVYHEHMYYLGAQSLNHLLSKYHFEIFDTLFSEIHGGTAIFLAARKGKKQISNRVVLCMEQERQTLWDTQSFLNFKNHANHTKSSLEKTLQLELNQRNKIGLYSVPNKVFTLLSYCNLPIGMFDMIVDSSPQKIGRYFPGATRPIVDEDSIKSSDCRVFLVGAWNYAKDIKEKAPKIFHPGTKLIFPLPKLEVFTVS